MIYINRYTDWCAYIINTIMIIQYCFERINVITNNVHYIIPMWDMCNADGYIWIVSN